ncbi:MAG TPA: VOC family protein [Candidatus Saccharimonadia bacterium]|nr:VOC family protein [Candidatus Saccharimonadia bacterium]
MSQLYANPYINFNGRAREAMEFYHKALGGKLDMTTFNPSGAPKAAAPGDSIMHASLESDGAIIMGTDGMEGHPAPAGQNVAIALGGSEHERLTKAFNDLSEGGKVTMPLKQESWGDQFGMFTDKFDIQWMVNISKAEERHA